MKQNLLKLLTLLFATNCFSQAPIIEWEKSFGGSNLDYPRNALVTSDGGYILFGNTQSNDGDVTNNHGGSDLWIVKMSGSGTLQWQKTLGGSGNEYGESIRETADGYIIVGYTYSNNGDVVGHHGGGNPDAWIVKLNTSGVIQWQKTLGTTDLETGRNIIATADGGYIVVAEKSVTIVQGPTTYSTTQYWIIKLDATGTVQWEKVYGGIGNSKPYDVLQTDDGGYVVIGETSAHDRDVVGNHAPLESVDIWMLKLTPTGEISWQKCYGGSLYERGFRIIKTNDGGYIIAGDSDSSNGDLTENKGYDDIWILKINNIGTIEWQKVFGGTTTDFVFDIFQTADSGYIFTGYTDSIDGDVVGNHGDCDAWVVKINSTGTILWQKTLGGSLCDSAFNIKPTSDGGFFMAGYNSSNDGNATQNHGSRDFWAVKLSQENLSAATFEKIKLSLFPNPASSQLNLQMENNETIDKIKITDLSGKLILEQNNNTNQVNTQNLASGIYFIQAFSGTNNYIAKFIKE